MQHLAAVYEPPPALLEGKDGCRGFPLSFEVAREAWAEEPLKTLWRASAPWHGSALPVLADEPASLAADDIAFRQSERQAAELEIGAFAIIREPDDDYLFLRLPAGTEPPARATLRVVVSAGARGAGRWRIFTGPLAGDGFVLRADAPAVFELDVPEDSRLSFDAVCIGAEGPGDAAAVRVLLDGRELARRAVKPSLEGVPERSDIALPAEGASGAQLELRTDGGGGQWLGIFEPRIAPVAPAEPERPDIVVFLADTFRADNLAAYGGTLGATPNLDRFAAQSLCYRRAWSPACWTLPSHASLFFGLFPPQHGATGQAATPGESLTSVAQRLRDAGYRTAAVTDGLFVSRKFELDRGFERFEEYHGDVDQELRPNRTLRQARRIWSESDGRPLFLFVHTYRTHEPYKASAEARAALGGKVALDTTWDELTGRLLELLRARVAEHGAESAEILELVRQRDMHELLERLGLGTESTPEGEAMIEALRGLYRGAAWDLDRAFGRFLADLDARERAGETWLVFTSDHGEALNEHRTFFHGQGFYEENLRIPLLIRGPGVEPAVIDHAASLVDLPQTLADIANLPPDAGWLGDSLLALKGDRPLFAFDCAQRGDPRGVAIENGLKVVFPPSAEEVRARRVVHAFDLAADPLEREDLSGDARARTALEKLADDVLKLLEPRAAPGRAELDAADLRQMSAMGYTGDG